MRIFRFITFYAGFCCYDNLHIKIRLRIIYRYYLLFSSDMTNERRKYFVSRLFVAEFKRFTVCAFDFCRISFVCSYIDFAKCAVVFCSAMISTLFNCTTDGFVCITTHYKMPPLFNIEPITLKIPKVLTLDIFSVDCFACYYVQLYIDYSVCKSTDNNFIFYLSFKK